MPARKTSPQTKSPSSQKDFTEGCLSNPAIQRLANAGNVLKLKKNAYSEIRKHAEEVATAIIKGAGTIVHHMDRKRITGDDVSESIRLAHIPFLHNHVRSEVEKHVVKCRVYDAEHQGRTKAERRVVFYAKQHNCVHFSRSGFERLVHSVADHYGFGTFQVSPDALALMQLAVESYIITLLGLAYKITTHAPDTVVEYDDADKPVKRLVRSGRATLDAHDIRLAVEIGQAA